MPYETEAEKHDWQIANQVISYLQAHELADLGEHERAIVIEDALAYVATGPSEELSTVVQ